MKLAIVAALVVIVSAQQSAPAMSEYNALNPGARITDGGTAAQSPSPNAEMLLAAALSRAKKDQKTLFLWFSVPW